MTSATRTLTGVFATLTALGAAEHGVGEILQGGTRPTGLLIQSWPDSPFFRIENGEPAMTVIPNLLAAGIVTVLLSAAYLVTALAAADRQHCGLVLVSLAVLLLLTGGGFGPPLLGIVVGITATRIPAHVRSSTGLGRRRAGPLPTSWRWWLAAALASWLLLLPGLPILDVTLAVGGSMAVVYTFAAAVVLLALAIWSALAHDAEQPVASEVQAGSRRAPSRSTTGDSAHV